MSTETTPGRPVAPLLPRAIRLSPGNSPSAPAAPRESSSEWAILAGLRFVLAFIVLTTHLEYAVPFDARHLGRFLWTAREMGGYAAVLGFFLISGYSIAASLDRDESSFFLRRFHRIAWVYWAAAGYALALVAIEGGTVLLHDGSTRHYQNAAEIVAMLLGFPVLFGPASGTFGIAWSLQCEICYYAVAPALKRMQLPALVCLALASRVLNLGVATINPDPMSAIWYLLPCVSLAWVWMLGFAFYAHRRNPFAIAAFVCLATIGPVLNLGGEPLDRLLVFVVAATIAAAPFIYVPKLASRVLNWFGDASYPLYLTQMTTVAAVYVLDPTGTSIMYIGCAIVVAALFLHGVDYPTRRLARQPMLQRPFRHEVVRDGALVRGRESGAKEKYFADT